MADVNLTRRMADSSEYLAHCDERRAFISGFNGSAGNIHQDFVLESTTHIFPFIPQVVLS